MRGRRPRAAICRAQMGKIQRRGIAIITRMPFYEYECPSCRFYTEVLQRISDAPLKKCPSCGKAGFKRLISAPVFRLKGSGWYETDFKSDKENKRNLVGEDREPAKPAEDKAKPAPDTAAKSEAKAEKPAAAKSASPKRGRTVAKRRTTRKPAPAKKRR